MAASAEIRTRLRNAPPRPVAGAPSPWGLRLPRPQRRTAACQSAAVQLRKCERLPPYPVHKSVRPKSGREWARSGRDLGGLVARASLVPIAYFSLAQKLESRILKSPVSPADDPRVLVCRIEAARAIVMFFGNLLILVAEQCAGEMKHIAPGRIRGSKQVR